MKFDMTSLIFLIIAALISLGVSLAISYLSKRGSRRWKNRYSTLPPHSKSKNPNLRQKSDQAKSKTPSTIKPTSTKSATVSLEEKYADAQSLEALALREIHQAQILRSTGNITGYYEALSSAVKKYISEKYDIKDANSFTTSRILDSLPQDLTAGLVDHVGEILRICDMAKLKSHRPSRSDLDHIFAITKEFIEQNISPPQDNNQSDAKKDEHEETDKLFRRYM